MIKKAFISLLFFPLFACASQIVNVYNFGDYIPPAVIKLFEKQTGIHVNYSTYETNQMLFTKLKAVPGAGYDVVFPSTYLVERMAKNHMLHKLDHSKLPGIKNLNPRLLNLKYDPNNQYSLPYLWGSTGIIVNSQYFNPKTTNRWRDLWQKRFRGRLLLTNDVRDVFSVGLRVAGYSINDRDPQHIYVAYMKLKQLLPNVKLFNSLGTKPVYLDEDALVGMIDSGDGYVLSQANPKLIFIYPRDGVNLWMDCMAIPKYAPHLKNSYRFINFILQPEIAKMISLSIGYSSPNLIAITEMPMKLQKNPILNPPEYIFDHAEMEGAVGDQAMALYVHYFEMLKLSA